MDLTASSKACSNVETVQLISKKGAEDVEAYTDTFFTDVRVSRLQPALEFSI